jgi:hypothetical protein|tara:strand:+ start:31020 stop:31307 length:288 start_codon:yes stop_codon:yes gene_type:complete
MNKLLLPFSIFCCLSLPLVAEEIIIPVGQQAAEKQSIERPTQGITKDLVQKRFGEPLEWNDPVGDPPISSWEYQDFVVFFEHDRVLHSVLKRNGK